MHCPFLCEIFRRPFNINDREFRPNTPLVRQLRFEPNAVICSVNFQSGFHELDSLRFRIEQYTLVSKEKHTRAMDKLGNFLRIIALI